jgi:hypothetical protein
MAARRMAAVRRWDRRCSGLDWIGREGGAGFAAERRMVGPEGGTGRSAGAGGRRQTHAGPDESTNGFFLHFILFSSREDR